MATMIYDHEWRDTEVRRNFGVLGLSFPIFRRRLGGHVLAKKSGAPNDFSEIADLPPLTKIISAHATLY